jgi:malic enzyme
MMARMTGAGLKQPWPLQAATLRVAKTGIGLGALLAGAPRISDEMLAAAAVTLADMVDEAELADGMLFPAVGRLREVSCAVAAAVIRVARGEPSDCPASAALLADVAAAMWVPRYASYVRAGVDTARD